MNYAKADEYVFGGKMPKTNADKIRSMSDKNLAEYLPIVSDMMCQPTDECMNIICNRGECTKTTECALKWLQSEAEQQEGAI